jgi:Tfp pilus assembly protein PilN
MIEINLLPGSGKKARSRGAGIDVAALASGVAAKIKDPFLVGAVVSALLAGVIVGGLYWYQNGTASSLSDQLQKAKQDSIRYAAVITQRRRAEARRDSVLHQVRLIESFDNKRYVWPHLMDEISRALPPYTWLTSVVQTNSTTAAQPDQAAPPKQGGKKGKGRAPAVDSTSIPRVKFQITGQTVDIQALTRFMKLLEASPFIDNVTLDKSAIVIVDGKQVTEFQLSASYQTPDSSAITLVPVSLSVR